ncbi:MAG: PP2C family protein-serine/threonine phosphatase, partial [Candidatus Zixiibacteriota bacterium]
PPECRMSIIAASSTPSRTVGGDFYDFITMRDQNRLGIVIADASGKGMPAALMVAQIQAILRSEVNNGNPIEMVLKNMNQQVATSTSSEKYVTLFYAELDMVNCEMKYANAGHNYPLLVRSDGSVELLDIGGPVIGAFPDIRYESASVRLQRDDVLFFFTDGLSEAMNTDGVEYGEARIREFLVSQRHLDPQQLLDGILADVRRHDPTSPPQDDTTIITMKVTNGAPSNV